MTHHTTTQQESIDIKGVFQSYNMKKYILIHFEIQKKLIVVSLFLLLAGFMGLQILQDSNCSLKIPWQLQPNLRKQLDGMMSKKWHFRRGHEGNNISIYYR